jgi:TM2 domain-containing membrane protein YozV
MRNASRARRTRRARHTYLPPAIFSCPMSTAIPMPDTPHFKSKTVAAGLAFLLGFAGAHRFYLYGRRDPFGWLHLACSAFGPAGLLLLGASTRGSMTGWIFTVIATASLLAAWLTAIVYGLRPDRKWDARFNPGSARRSQSGWTVVFIVVFSLFFGAMLLMGGLAYAFQTYFEAQSGLAGSLG